MEKSIKKCTYLEGLKDGLPIGLGYFAVSFSLGIIAKKAGLNPVQGFIASILNHASAGEYALFTSIQQSVRYVEIILLTLVINARYFLMSCALSQRFDPEMSIFHRLFVCFGITDELFGINIARPSYIDYKYAYGAMTSSIPLWAMGTSLGILAGTYLPKRIVTALSVSLYGMFIAIIVPQCKKNLVVLISVLVSFALSFSFNYIPYIKTLSGGTKVIIITILVAAVAAIVKPVKDEETVEREGSEASTEASGEVKNE
ncbi:MAG: AzlC family ABC transporter permease [Treponema sp.]|nr:AzlC family ABC transporter permease [Treponema sp.]